MSQHYDAMVQWAEIAERRKVERDQLRADLAERDQRIDTWEWAVRAKDKQILEFADAIAKLGDDLAARGRENERLRVMLFDSHGCNGKYGDDGEMQCNRAPFIDFKRDPVEDLEQKTVAHGMQQLAARERENAELRSASEHIQFNRDELDAANERVAELERAHEALRAENTELRAQVEGLRGVLKDTGSASHDGWCWCAQPNFLDPRRKHEPRCLDARATLSTTPAQHRSQAFREGIYVASRVKHAAMWLQLRAEGAPIISTWIDEAGEGETGDYSELAARCLREAAHAKAVVLYCEPGEILKGATMEVGAALAFGVPVYCVGECESVSRVFVKHPLWKACESVDAAMAAIRAEAARAGKETANQPQSADDQLRAAARAIYAKYGPDLGAFFRDIGCPIEGKEARS